MPMNALELVSTAAGRQAFARRCPTYVDARSLAAGVAESHTIPDGAAFVIFSATADFYAKPGGTAAVPGDVTDGSGSELNPVIWCVFNVTSIGLIAPANTVVTMTFYT